MVGDKDADVAVFQPPHDVLDIFHSDRIDTGKRLVEHDELGVDGQTSGYLRAASLTAGELVALVLAHLVEPEFADQALQLVKLVAMRPAGHFKHRHDIVFHAHFAKHAGLLRQIAYAGTGTFVDGIVGDFFIVDVDVSLVGHHQSGSHIERGGLAGSVGAEQPHDFSLLHIDGHAVGHRAGPVAFHQSFCAQHGPLTARLCYTHVIFVHNDEFGCKITKKQPIIPYKIKNYSTKCSF